MIAVDCIMRIHFTAVSNTSVAYVFFAINLQIIRSLSYLEILHYT
jgi:hypothetical protein